MITLVEDAISEARAAALRERLELKERWLADRAHIAENANFIDAALFAELGALASARAQLPPLGPPVAAVATRLVRGSYALMKDDHYYWLAAGRRGAAIDLTLDFSAQSSAEAHIIYLFADAREAIVPQRARMAAILDRRTPAARYERYLSIAVGDAQIFRLRLAFPLS